MVSDRSSLTASPRTPPPDPPVRPAHGGSRPDPHAQLKRLLRAWRPRPRRSRRATARLRRRTPLAGAVSRDCAVWRHRPSETPIDPAGERRRRLPRRAGTHRARARARRGTAHCETPGRNRRCETASRARPADEPPGRSPSHRQALATLGATALEREAAGASSHAGTKAVRTGALALLRLIGAFHG